MIPIFVLTYAFTGSDTVQDAALALDTPRPFLTREAAEESAQDIYDQSSEVPGWTMESLGWRRVPDEQMEGFASHEWTCETPDRDEGVSPLFKFVIRRFELGG